MHAVVHPADQLGVRSEIRCTGRSRRAQTSAPEDGESRVPARPAQVARSTSRAARRRRSPHRGRPSTRAPS